MYNIKIIFLKTQGMNLQIGVDYAFWVPLFTKDTIFLASKGRPLFYGNILARQIYAFHITPIWANAGDENTKISRHCPIRKRKI
jgi:hypothetical protein